MDDLVRRGVDKGDVALMKLSRIFIEDYGRERDIIRETASVSPYPPLPSYTANGVPRATTLY